MVDVLRLQLHRMCTGVWRAGHPAALSAQLPGAQTRATQCHQNHRLRMWRANHRRRLVAGQYSLLHHRNLFPAFRCRFGLSLSVGNLLSHAHGGRSRLHCVPTTWLFCAGRNVVFHLLSILWMVIYRAQRKLKVGLI